MGQLKTIIQSTYMVPVIGMHKVPEKPFKAVEIEVRIIELLKTKKD